MNEKQGISIGTCILWVFGYFCIMLLYTFINMFLWRRMFPDISEWGNVVTIIICSGAYFWLLIRSWQLNISNMLKLNYQEVVLTVICSVAFFLLMDCFIDPIIEKAFPVSERNYQEAVASLKENPITSVIQVCIITPIAEELLMRGFALELLKKRYGIGIALIVSTLLFALLHFNMVQTLSALITGFILGLLYLKTKSLASTILAHGLYNLASLIALVML